MKIVMIGPVYPYRGGIAHFTTLLASKLQEANHVVQMVSFKRQYPTWLYPGETDLDTSQNPLVFPAQYQLDPLYPWTWVRTAREIVRSKPELVIIQWWTTFWSPALSVIARILRGSSLRVVYQIHNVMPHEAHIWDRWLSCMALSAADSFIALSEREAARLRSLFPKARIQITSLPVYNMFSENPITRDEARVKLNLPQNEPVVLFFGIVRPYKGLRYLLQAFEMLKKQHFSGHLLIAGDFWEPLSKYQALIAELGIADQVHIFNRYIPNEDIPTFFNAADLFVAPYIDGTQSASAKMALGFSLPMVLTRCIVDETLSIQPNIWQVAEKDSQSLATAIASALETSRGIRSEPAVDDWSRVVQVIEGI